MASGKALQLGNARIEGVAPFQEGKLVFLKLRKARHDPAESVRIAGIQPGITEPCFQVRLLALHRLEAGRQSVAFGKQFLKLALFFECQAPLHG